MCQTRRMSGSEGAFDHPNALGPSSDRLEQLFGERNLLPLWVAEPYLPLAPAIRAAIERRAHRGWYGYEARPDSLKAVFWDWMGTRHRWDGEGCGTIVSPSVGTSIGVLLNELTEEGDGVIIQPPVFTDFKPLITASNRRVVRNPLLLGPDGYRMDLDRLAELASVRSTRVLILCNPHNPVGRLWSPTELGDVARICASNNVVIVADEIHADLALPPHSFTPLANAAQGIGARWAATHGPIKTFGLAGVCDTLLVSDDAEITGTFEELSNRLHLTRNNVFSMAAFEAAYREGADWLDDLLDLMATNIRRLRTDLDPAIAVLPHEATYLAWLDFRRLGLEAPELVSWLAAAGVALSPGHWFGRHGAGFARMSIAVEPPIIEQAINLLNRAVATTR